MRALMSSMVYTLENVLFVTFGQYADYGPTALFHKAVDVVSAFGSLDRAVYGDGDSSRARESCIAWHDIVCPVDGDGHDGHIEFGGKEICAAFESPYPSVACSRAFGKDDDAHAAAETSCGVVEGGTDSGGVGAVDKYVSAFVACVSYKWDFAQRRFHHPAEVVSKKSVYAEDVECSLVVCDKDVGCVGVDVAASVDMYTDKIKPAEEFCPNLGGPVSPESASGRQASDDSGDGCENGEDDKEGYRNEYLVDTEDIYHSVGFCQ